MDVTRQNFPEVYAQLDSLISACEFVSIDVEFSGLVSAQKTNELETYEQLYLKTKNNVEPFQILQLGLTLFTNTGVDTYDCHSYNFYIYPSRCSLLEETRERCFLSQSSSLKFLIENGFDFNKVISEGINYSPLSLMNTLMEKINGKVNELDRPKFIEVETEEDKKFVEEVTNKIKNLVNSTEQELVLPSSNSYYRRLIYETIQKSDHKEKLEVSTLKQAKGEVLVKKCTSTRTKDDEKNLLLLQNTGFSLVIDLLLKYRKPLVGHCLFIDLLYIYKSFIGTLPLSYREFKTEFNLVFAAIYDTRLISLSPKLKDFIPQGALQKVYESVCRDPFPSTHFHLKNDKKNYHAEGSSYHEAGFDSFITGCCFVQMLRYICNQELGQDPIRNLLNNPMADKFKNKISIYGNYDIKFLNLDGEDEQLSRKNVFYLTFPSTFNTKDLQLIFADYGGTHRVVWINDTSAFCILKDPDSSSKVVENLIVKAKESTPFKVQHYYDYLKNQKNASKNGPSPPQQLYSKMNSASLNTSPKPMKKLKLDSRQKISKKQPMMEKMFEDNYHWSNPDAKL